MNNYKLKIAYDGTRYLGWQRLKDSDKTIQGKIEQVLSKLHNEEINIVGSGRTDAGVHAREQVANYWTKDKSVSDIDILEYLCKYLPEDIVVFSVELVDDRFHSRFRAEEKTYTYYIRTAMLVDPFNRKYEYHLGQSLDIEKIIEAKNLLEGTHDFSSFTTTKSKKKSMERTIYRINIKETKDVVAISFTGDGFLYNMVRILVGTLIDIGLGELDIEELEDILNSKCRANAGPLAPSCGLFLEKVKY